MYSFKFARALVAAAVALVAVNAAPTNSVTDMEARAALVDGELFVTTDANWNGIRDNIAFTVGQCLNFVSPFQDTISSFGPQRGFICTAYTDSDCRGLTYAAIYPGFATLPPGINDALSSFKCFRQ